MDLIPVFGSDFIPAVVCIVQYADCELHIADYGSPMTDRRTLAERQLNQAVRELSHELFGRHHQLEVAAAAVRVEATFSFEEAFEEAKSRALRAGLEPPGRSAVRTNLERLAQARALSQVVGTRTGEKHTWIRLRESSFWTWCEQIWPT